MSFIEMFMGLIGLSILCFSIVQISVFYFKYKGENKKDNRNK